MRICVNCLFLYPGRTHGTRTYCTEIMDRWCMLGVDFFVMVNPAMYDEFCGRYGGARVLVVNVRNRFARVLYEQLFLMRTACRHEADVLFCPGYMGPMWGALPTVITVHDTQFRDIPTMVSFSQRLIYNLIVPRASRRAKRIITVSEFAKGRINEELGIDGNNIAMIYEAPQQLPAGCGAPVGRVRGRDYVMTVTGPAPHKNVWRLIQAFSSVRKQCACDLELIIVGRVPSEFLQSHNRMEGVVFCPFLSREDLGALYRNARAFIFPSLYEGFGLPVLEAMAAGIPVATSPAGSLAEVSGDAALLFDPMSVDSIGRAILTVVNDTDVARSLVARGYENLKRFSWDRCATLTLDVLEKAARRSA